jgi:hypothetical protein
MAIQAIMVCTLISALAALPGSATAADDRIRIQGIAPGSGPVVGKQAFQLRGTGFDALPAGALGVLFDDVPATDVQKDNDRAIVGYTPAHPEGFVEVVIAIDGVPYRDAGKDRYRYGEGGGGPSECATADDCNDQNPCSLDVCATTCQSTAVDSADDVVAGAPGCAGLTMPAKVGKKFAAGCAKLAQRATAPSDRKRAKLRKKAISSFTKAATAVGKAQALAGDCATQLGATLEAARGYAESQ